MKVVLPEDGVHCCAENTERGEKKREELSFRKRFKKNFEKHSCSDTVSFINNIHHA
jgi:hypothetical protein